jgi:hypothetical protein
MTIEILSGILGGFVAGYFFARLDFIYAALRTFYGLDSSRAITLESRIQQPTSFFEKEKKAEKAAVVKEKLGKIDIDTRTVVTKIDTDTIQPGSDVELGRTTAQADTINLSVNKLAQLKGK